MRPEQPLRIFQLKEAIMLAFFVIIAAVIVAAIIAVAAERIYRRRNRINKPAGSQWVDARIAQRAQWMGY
jgi:Na+-translocating ferredoxin:NAD+ oxidoreductase RnfG subunit